MTDNNDYIIYQPRIISNKNFFHAFRSDVNRRYGFIKETEPQNSLVF